MKPYFKKEKNRSFLEPFYEPHLPPPPYVQILLNLFSVLTVFSAQLLSAGANRAPPWLTMYRIYTNFAHTLVIDYERIESAVLFLLDAAYLDSPSKRVIFPRVEVYCRIEVALGHEPPAQRDQLEDSSLPHAQGAPQEDRKDGHSPASPSVQTPESRTSGVVESPGGSSSKQSPASLSTPPQPCPEMSPGLPTDPRDTDSVNLQTPSLKEGVKDGCEPDSATNDNRGTKSLPPVSNTSDSAADAHSSEAGSLVPESSPESPHCSGLLHRHPQAATASGAASGLPPSGPSTPPALPPVEEPGPERPTGMSLPALSLETST